MDKDLSSIYQDNAAKKMHFHFFRKTLLALLTCLMAACATPTFQFQSPPPRMPGLPPGYTLSNSPRLEQTSHMVTHLDQEKNILYFQNRGGGGVMVGALFGPVGVLTNMAMIKAVTATDAKVLFEKINIKPREIFSEAAKKQGLDTALTTPQALKITPYLYVTKADNDQLLLAAALLIEKTEAEPWVGKYMYQLSSQYSIDAMSQLSSDATTALRKELRDGFSALLAQIELEGSAPSEAERPITFESDFLSPRISIKMVGRLIREDADIVWIRASGGVFGIRKSNLSYPSTSH